MCNRWRGLVDNVKVLLASDWENRFRKMGHLLLTSTVLTCFRSTKSEPQKQARSKASKTEKRLLERIKNARIVLTNVALQQRRYDKLKQQTESLQVGEIKIWIWEIFVHSAPRQKKLESWNVKNFAKLKMAKFQNFQVR